MAKNKVSPTELDDEVYVLSKTFVTRVVIGAVLIFIFSVFSTFPVKENIALMVTNALQANRSCPISFEKVEVSFFLPSITIKDTAIEGACFNNQNTRLPLNDVKLYFFGPSLSPLGLKFKTEIQKGKTNLDIYLSAGMGSQSIRISESKLDAEIINIITGEKFLLGGIFDIDTVLFMEKGKLNSGNIFVKSSSLFIPTQNISTFEVPHMPVENLIFKATIEPEDKKFQKIQIENFEIGSNDAPILGQIKGPIKLNQSFVQSSELSLSGKVKFSKNFMDNFAILNLFLGGKSTDNDGFYKINVSGSLGAPKPKFL